jgi:vacuolar-type H+-ATPase subunit E/Vma4
MTRQELQEMISNAVESAVEQKLLEILGDPDEGLTIRKQVVDRLARQKKAVARGERGRSLDEVARELGLQ